MSQFLSREEMREKEEAKAAKKRKRKAYAEERAALRPEFDPALSKDGIERFFDPLRNHMREICRTPEAMGLRREELYARSGGECEGCKFGIGVDRFHLHHIFGRGAGKRCDCLDCIQALCNDALMQDGSWRFGCHHKVHASGKLDGRYERDSDDEVGGRHGA